MPRRINQAGLDLIKQAEGLRLTAYQDVAGIWTIGYGHTGPVAGKPIRKGLRITTEQAEALLRDDLATAEAAVEAACPEATDNQFAALVSLAYNIGAGAFRTSTVRRMHDLRRHSEAADAFLMWRRASGKEVAGLKARRERERQLYLT